jgi:alkylation response protein AidB-like acyl-CoA dehydrogenase
LIDQTNSSFELDDDHLAFQETCRAFVERVLLSHRDEAERTRTFPQELWAEFSKAGLLGLRHPEELGGSGGTSVALAILSEELATVSGGLAITVLVSSYMAAPHLALFGSPALQEQYLRPIIAGELVAAIAVTEPGSGSDVAGMRTSATEIDGGFLINGSKMFITNGGIADVIIVSARTSSDDRHGGITMFAVDASNPGMTVSAPLVKMGWRSSDTRELTFEECFVPADHVVGTTGRGFHQIMGAFQGERIVLAAMGVGLARSALAEALAWAKDRHAFGSPIGSNQAISHRLSEMATSVATARLLTWQAAARLDSGHAEAASSVAMAKLYGARVANDVADAAVQIFGGYGFMDETPVALHYRDARILRIGGGTDEIQMEILARQMGL